MHLLPKYASRAQDTSALVNRIHHAEFFELCGAMPDASVDMVLCDIPYNEIDNVIRIWKPELSKSGGIRRMTRGIADTSIIDIQRMCHEFDRITTQWIYVFCGYGQVSEIADYFKPKYTTRVAVWEKTNPSPINGEYVWLSACEFCVVARKPKATFNQHCVSSVWRFPAGSRELHPTQKNTDLFKYLIESSTNKSDIIFDPCVGSGTTAVAARNTGRQFVCGDFTHEYVEIARRRVAGLPGKQPEPGVPRTIHMFAEYDPEASA